MSDLYPTKTRLALLRDIADGHVRSDVVTGWRNYRTGRKVTDSVWTLRAARWVEFPPRGTDGPVALTDAGRAVLDAHGGAR